MANATASYFLEQKNTRQLVISRSSFPGHGRFASKWLGDNFSEWSWMAWSIGGAFNFQIFGIPMVGSDICGFNGSPDFELCLRWYQLGSLYPFSRKHTSISSPDKAPWSYGEDYIFAFNTAIRTKYELIFYYYTNMFMVSMYGGAFFKPAFFEFTHDMNLIETHNSDNFMIGSDLIVHPCLTKGKTTVDAYFPTGLWYNWYTGELVRVPFNRIATLDAPLTGFINIHMRGGSIITKSEGYMAAGNIEELRKHNITLVIASDPARTAIGHLVLDDGVSPNTISQGEYTSISYYYSEKSEMSASLKFHVVHAGYTKATGEWPNVSLVTIYGCARAIDSIKDVSNDKVVSVSTSYDSNRDVCTAYLSGVVPDEAAEFEITFR